MTKHRIYCLDLSARDGAADVLSVVKESLSRQEYIDTDERGDIIISELQQARETAKAVKLLFAEIDVSLWSIDKRTGEKSVVQITLSSRRRETL